MLSKRPTGSARHLASRNGSKLGTIVFSCHLATRLLWLYREMILALLLSWSAWRMLMLTLNKLSVPVHAPSTHRLIIPLASDSARWRISAVTTGLSHRPSTMLIRQPGAEHYSEHDEEGKLGIEE